MALDQNDHAEIQRTIYHNLSPLLASNFGRLEKRIDAAEARLHGRLAEIEERADIHPKRGLAPDNLPVEPEREDD